MVDLELDEMTAASGIMCIASDGDGAWRALDGGADAEADGGSDGNIEGGPTAAPTVEMMMGRFSGSQDGTSGLLRNQRSASSGLLLLSFLVCFLLFFLILFFDISHTLVPPRRRLPSCRAALCCLGVVCGSAVIASDTRAQSHFQTEAEVLELQMEDSARRVNVSAARVIVVAVPGIEDALDRLGGHGLRNRRSERCRRRRCWCC